MTGWVPGDVDSPNRLDALVWALTDLMLTGPQAVVLPPGAMGGPTKVPAWRVE